MRMAISRFSFKHHLWFVHTIVKSYERFPIRVETLNRCVDTIECKVITAFTIFCLMVNDAALDFHFTRREITLEVFHIGSSIPQTPFREREKFEVAHFL